MFCGSPKSQVADRGLKPQRRSGSNAALKRRSSTGLRIAIYKAAMAVARGCSWPCARPRLAIGEAAVRLARGRGWSFHRAANWMVWADSRFLGALRLGMTKIRRRAGIRVLLPSGSCPLARVSWLVLRRIAIAPNARTLTIFVTRRKGLDPEGNFLVITKS